MSCPAHMPAVTSHHTWNSIQRPHGDLQALRELGSAFLSCSLFPSYLGFFFCSTNSSDKALPQCFAMAIPFVWNTLLSSVCITEYLSLFGFPLRCHLLIEVFSIHLGCAREGLCQITRRNCEPIHVFPSLHSVMSCW